ncbi:hypothetical protein Ddc_04194 [Ditylenchus destructor]|nr:hypothetical protein Ddc_04194 [Ditylenchus destructor]
MPAKELTPFTDSQKYVLEQLDAVSRQSDDEQKQLYCKGNKASIDPTMNTNASAETTRTNSPEQTNNVFRISIQNSFEKAICLPHLSAWNRLEYPENFVRGRLAVQLIAKGLFMKRETGWLLCNCVLSRQGQLVIYSEESSLKGYAVNINRAKKIVIQCGKLDQSNMTAKIVKLKPYCLLTIKWNFGAILMNLLEQQIAEWRQFILDVYEQTSSNNRTLSSPLSDSISRKKQETAEALPLDKAQTNPGDKIRNGKSGSVGYTAKSGKHSDAIHSTSFKSVNSSMKENSMDTTRTAMSLSPVAVNTNNSSDLNPCLKQLSRRHTLGAHMHLNSSYKKTPIPDWADDFESTPLPNRFRMTKEYFERCGKSG